MTSTVAAPQSSERQEILRRYYSWHSPVYDGTRWSFLFGRTRLMRRVIQLTPAPRRILEIGCGTGSNLRVLASGLPRAHLLGVDGSSSMLRRAAHRLRRWADRVQLQDTFYKAPLALDPAPDLILFSYCLSMLDTQWPEALEAAQADLAPGGWLAVVDFHGSRFPGFRRWMARNHVRMERHLLPALQQGFEPVWSTVESAYGGCWDYFLFLGRGRSHRQPGV